MKKYLGNKTLRLAVVAAILVVISLAAIKVYFAVIRIQVTDKAVSVVTLKDIPVEWWGKLAEKKIFFGHQGVGSNILEGIKQIEAKSDFIHLKIVEVNDITIGSGPVFMHEFIGHCPDVMSKTRDFENIMNKLANEKIDIAFMKLCYEDIEYEYNTDIIFKEYKKAIDELKARYPQVLFLHITVPLNTNPKGSRILRETAKFFAYHPSIWDDNLKRQQYNARLVNAFGKTDPIFDLAAAESTDSRGFRYYATVGKEKVFLLDPDYSINIGGLNDTGKRKIAEQFLIFLAETAHNQQ